jgi:hypothetical protein
VYHAEPRTTERFLMTTLPGAGTYIVSLSR